MAHIFIPILLAVISIHGVAAFGGTTARSLSISTKRMHARNFPSIRTKMIPNEEEIDVKVKNEQLWWDPLEFQGPNDSQDPTNGGTSGSSWLPTVLPLLFLMGAIGIVGGGTSNAWASALSETTAMFDPNNFQPVCPASDGVYNIMKTVASTLVGRENVVEYGPLIASVLLRIRLELCVLESFLYEAVVPFIQKKGTYSQPDHSINPSSPSTIHLFDTSVSYPLDDITNTPPIFLFLVLFMQVCHGYCPYTKRWKPFWPGQSLRLGQILSCWAAPRSSVFCSFMPM